MRESWRSVVLAAAMLALTASTAQASTFVVDRFDNPAGAGTCTATPNDCSLEQAMELANAKPDSDLVQIGAGEYVGGFAYATAPVVLAGAGTRQTILNGANEGLLLNVQEAGAVEVRDLTITNGHGGGPSFGAGVYLGDKSALTLRRLAIVGNQDSGDPQYLTQHYLGFGGGVLTNGDSTLLIEESLIAHNTAYTGTTGTAAWGGGLRLGNPSTVIRNSTISDNHAASTATTAARGGGINLSAGYSLELDNVTLAGNTVTGGTSGETAETTEGGNLWLGAGSTVKVRGSIVALGSAPLHADCNASVTTLGSNVEDRNECGFGPADRTSVDPLLGALANNTGPTDTRALGSGSPAINFAGGCGLVVDERGVARSDGLCDVGAFEYVPPPKIVPTPIPAPPRPPSSKAPAIASATQSHSVWREGSKLASLSRSEKKAPLGTTFSFTLDQQASVSFVFTQQVGGRSVSGKCVTQTRTNRHRHACKRILTRGVMPVAGLAGANKLTFLGLLSRSKKLPLGRYTLLITAMNAAEQRSRTRSLHFTIVR